MSEPFVLSGYVPPEPTITVNGRTLSHEETCVVGIALRELQTHTRNSLVQAAIKSILCTMAEEPKERP